MTLELIFLIIALILFIVDVVGSYMYRIQLLGLQSAGLAFIVAACLVQMV